MIFRNHNNILIYCSRNVYDYYQCWKIEIFCNIINVFTVIFDQFNASVDNYIYWKVGTHTHTHTRAHTRTQTQTHTHTHTQTQTQTQTQTHTHTCFLLACPTTIHAYTNVHIYAVYCHTINSVLFSTYEHLLYPNSSTRHHYETQNTPRRCNVLWIPWRSRWDEPKPSQHSRCCMDKRMHIHEH